MGGWVLPPVGQALLWLRAYIYTPGGCFTASHHLSPRTVSPVTTRRDTWRSPPGETHGGEPLLSLPPQTMSPLTMWAVASAILPLCWVGTSPAPCCHPQSPPTSSDEGLPGPVATTMVTYTQCFPHVHLQHQPPPAPPHTPNCPLGTSARLFQSLFFFFFF